MQGNPCAEKPARRFFEDGVSTNKIPQLTTEQRLMQRDATAGTGLRSSPDA
jgi:hypothetical protein